MPDLQDGEVGEKVAQILTSGGRCSANHGHWHTLPEMSAAKNTRVWLPCIGYHQRIYSICSYTHTLHRKTKGREIIHNANKFPKVYPIYKFCSKDALVPRALPKKAPSLPQPLRTTTTLHRKSPHMLPGSEMDRTQSHPCRRQS